LATALLFGVAPPLFIGMTDKERQVLEGQLAEIDRRRAELEIVLGTIPLNRYDRQELEAELRGLWSLRLELAEQLSPRPHAA
jgi:hypothetical protein